MTQEKLDAQRDVVRKRAAAVVREPAVAAKVDLRLPELLYPEGHPYHHPVIGSHEDLQAATVADVKAFFARWYAPNNISPQVVAGDVDPARVGAEIDRLFGWMPRADVPAEATPPTPVLKGVVRETLPDDDEAAPRS